MSIEETAIVSDVVDRVLGEAVDEALRRPGRAANEAGETRD